jgi:FkbM family methyltransferase
MKPIKAVQAMLARCGIMAYRRSTLPVGVDLVFDINRLFGEPATILDVGANCGQTALSFADGFPSAKIYAFEPVPTTFEQLKANTAHVGRISCSQEGLGSHDHRVTIRLGANERNSVLNEAPADANGQTATLSITTGDSWAAARGVSSIDLLKIDTEGYDLEVLKGFQILLNRGAIKAVLVECEFDAVTPEPHTSFFELHEFLAQRGMRLITLYTDCATRDGFAWGNALFARVPGESARTERGVPRRSTADPSDGKVTP